ncbi:DNA gyrase inhibitor YacG [Acidomonas methanolica]|uniref:DNA gyrase inhibitor YacG n=1 Tax=Acidomonas methanolica TaxID=437 RepID=UPI002119E8FC|nr:DNA gyrase inhibitor YacG [Acidomonas methanolica]MCQ9154727.1 DNA gyrase inhibitor YacG [Acidomonas methanolica]
MSSCPICQRPSVPAFRPFCSRRCADIDLGRWFNGSYRVPSTREEEEDETKDEKTVSPPLDPSPRIS